MVSCVARMAALTILCGASLVCSPAVGTTTLGQVDFDASPALALSSTDLVAELAATGLAAAPTVATVVPVPAAAPIPFVAPIAPEQWFAPSGKNQGTEGLAMFLAGVALRDNVPLYISETVGRRTGSPNSDHYVGRTDSWAVDVAVRGIQQPTPQTHLAAKRISTALGEANWAGGDLTRTINGYRFQVLWLVEGHYNHVHVGVRKL